MPNPTPTPVRVSERHRSRTAASIARDRTRYALGQLFFIPMVFVPKGHWSPDKANLKAKADAHDAFVDSELRMAGRPAGGDQAAPRR